jgi:hypothetical protein
MKLSEYFEGTAGFGVLATADAEGRVNAAVYGRPHVLAEDTVAFIMADKKTRANIEVNGSAVYLFKESGAGYRGKRLYLQKLRIEPDSPLIGDLRRRARPPGSDGAEAPRFLVSFRVERVLPLVGAQEDPFA